MEWMTLLTGGLDWVTAFSFFVVALFYFLAPALGYAPSSRAHLLRSLWTLAGLVMLTLLQQFFLLIGWIDVVAMGKEKEKALPALLFILRTSLYGYAILTLITGLQNLRHKNAPPETTARHGGRRDAPPRPPAPEGGD